MARTTMADLIDRLRLLIGDPNNDDAVAMGGASQQFSDEQVQAFLDGRRIEVRECILAYRPTTSSGGTIEYRDFYAPHGDWEDTVVLHDSSFTALTPATADLAAGHWTLATTPTLPVYASGAYYDLPGAAYDALGAWAGAVSRDFDFTTERQEFNRSQKFRQMLALRAEMARAMLPRGLRAPWRANVGEW